MAARGFIGAGDIYIQRIENGVPGDLKGPYFADKFEIKPNVEVKELSSKGRNTYGQVLESVPLQQPADFSLDLKEVNRESLTIALLGTQAAVDQAASTITDHPLEAKLGVWLELPKGQLENIVVKDSAGATTYVLGTDYEVNPYLGMVKPLEGGGIADGADIKVSATVKAYKGAVISGGTQTDIRARIRFDGINKADGLPVIVEVHEAIIAADAAFDFLADDFNTVSMPGKLKTPVGKNAPFTVELRDSGI